MPHHHHDEEVPTRMAWVSSTTGVLVSISTMVGFIVGALLWMQSTFVDASEFLEVQASIIQMEINASKKELRALKREYRRASHKEKAALEDDMDKVKDDIAEHESEKRELFDAAD